MNQLFWQTEKIDPITDFHPRQDLAAFDKALVQHRPTTINKPTTNQSLGTYLKFCLLLELIRRDGHESCLRIFLRDIIFRFHLAEFIIGSSDWFVQQAVEFYIVIKIESMWVGIDCFWTKLSHGVNVGQVDTEVMHWPARQQLSPRIVSFAKFFCL